MARSPVTARRKLAPGGVPHVSGTISRRCPASLECGLEPRDTAGFDGGQISSDGGVLLLAAADKRLGLIDRLAALIPDHRDTALITHTMADILRARGQAQTLTKRHKGPLASDRTSCRSPLANQMRLVPHTAAFWLMRSIHQAVPVDQPLASGDFRTIRPRRLKIAVRVRETATRIRLAFAANCPDAALFRRLLTTGINPKPARTRGSVPCEDQCPRTPFA